MATVSRRSVGWLLTATAFGTSQAQVAEFGLVGKLVGLFGWLGSWLVWWAGWLVVGWLFWLSRLVVGLFLGWLVGCVVGWFGLAGVGLLALVGMFVGLVGSLVWPSIDESANSL